MGADSDSQEFMPGFGIYSRTWIAEISYFEIFRGHESLSILFWLYYPAAD